MNACIIVWDIFRNEKSQVESINLPVVKWTYAVFFKGRDLFRRAAPLSTWSQNQRDGSVSFPLKVRDGVKCNCYGVTMTHWKQDHCAFRENWRWLRFSLLQVSEKCLKLWVWLDSICLEILILVQNHCKLWTTCCYCIDVDAVLFVNIHCSCHFHWNMLWRSNRCSLNPWSYYRYYILTHRVLRSSGISIYNHVLHP